MKNIICILFLLLLSAQCTSLQQKQKHYHLTVSVQPCYHPRGEFVEDFQLKKQEHIIQTPPKTDSSRNLTPFTEQYELQYVHLDSGQYTLQFTNFYNQKVSQIIDLKALTTKIKVCVDTFVDTHELTFFEKMTPNDSLICEFGSLGCFHANKESYKFKYENGILIGTLITDKLKIIRKTLTPKDLAYLIQFEKQLRQMRFVQGGCTTRNTFIFHLNHQETLSIQDETCRWYGEIDLKKKIFGISGNAD